MGSAMKNILVWLILLVGLVGASAANAQATRTWVSGVGDDANPCSRTAPCKTFAGAISKTAAGGEINVLDPGGFGAVTITKSIAIISDSVEAGVLVSGTNGIIINALPSDSITLRGLNVDGLGTGLSGILVLSAGNVHINNCLIRNFGQSSSGNGISIAPTSANVNVVVRNCYISNNRQGIAASPTGTGQALVAVSDTTIVNNTGIGIRSVSAAANVKISNNVIANNNNGLYMQSGGTITSFGNNVITNNNNNGTPNGGTLPLQ
jgi:hypothetical protein